jgi:putative phage-type endonuclease
VGTSEHEAWLEERKKSIGASEVSTVLGMNPWQTPLTLYLLKRGEIPPIEETLKMRMGHLLEPIIAKLYHEETSRELVDPGEYAIVRHSDTPWMHATLDRRIVCSASCMGATEGVLQLKAPGAHMKHEWEGQIPLYVQAQVQAEMHSAQLEWGSAAALIGGQHFVWDDLERNDRFIAWMLQKTKEFMGRIQNGDPPEAEAGDTEALKMLHPKVQVVVPVQLTEKAVEWDSELQQLKAEKKKLEKAIAKFEAKLKQQIGDAEQGDLPGGGAYTWKSTERAGYTVQPGIVRTLRRIK